MPSKRRSGSPVPGVIREPVRARHDEPDEVPRATPAAIDPAAERDARRKAREDRRGPRSERPEVRSPSRRRRRPLEAPLMRGVAYAGIVGIAVAVAAIMSSQGSQGWLIGLATSIVTLVLGAVLSPSRRLSPRPATGEHAARSKGRSRRGA
jgi:hypothetical protein